MYFAPPTANDTARLLALGNEPLGFKIFSILSHAGFFVLFGYALAYRRPLLAILTFAACSGSLLYHTCGEFGKCAGLTFDTTRDIDHFTASLLLVALASLFFEKMSDAINQKITLTQEEADAISTLEATNVGVLDRDDGDVGDPTNPPLYSDSFAKFWIAFAIGCVAISVIVYGPENSNPSIVALVASMISLAIYAGAFHIEPKEHVWEDYYAVAPRKLHYPFLVMGFAFILMGMGFFWFPNQDNSMMHSLWHLFASLGILFFLFATERKPIGAVYRIEFEAELYGNDIIMGTGLGSP